MLVLENKAEIAPQAQILQKYTNVMKGEHQENQMSFGIKLIASMIFQAFNQDTVASMLRREFFFIIYSKLMTISAVLRGESFHFWMVSITSCLWCLNHMQEYVISIVCRITISALINPSDEDSRTFTINTASGEVVKFKANDARSRQGKSVCMEIKGFIWKIIKKKSPFRMGRWPPCSCWICSSARKISPASAWKSGSLRLHENLPETATRNGNMQRKTS